jgi:hypothetical protein
MLSIKYSHFHEEYTGVLRMGKAKGKFTFDVPVTTFNNWSWSNVNSFTGISNNSTGSASNFY